MAATDFNFGGIPVQGGDEPCKNTSGSDMTAGQLVKLDTANPLSGTQPAPGIVLTSGATDLPYGVLIENCKSNDIARVRRYGRAVCIAAGAISVGAKVGASSTAGDVTTYTGGDPWVGQALTAAANAADPIVVALWIAPNA